MAGPYVIDLHAHFPMQFDPERDFRAAMRRRRHRRERLRDKIKFAVLEIADRFFNRESPHDGHAVTIDTLARGNVGVAFSVVYCPFLELDVAVMYGAPPQHGYFREVRRMLKVVESEIDKDARAVHVKDFAELVAARAAGKVAMVHAIEGGLHIDGDGPTVDAHVKELAEMGLGYITVAHLFYRSVATNVPALPFLSDKLYRLLFPQDSSIGLTDRGKDLVRSMAKHGVLIDVTHMSELGMEQTFDLLDAIDPAKKMPVIASHIACSHFGGYAYNLSEKWVKKIAERNGVCGIIYCDHYIRDSVGAQTKTFAESFALIKDQVRKLRAWGGDDILAIGSDLDGFIKPTLAGLSSALNHADLADALAAEYGDALAKKICHENSLRVLEAGWRKGV
jgi:microsomal dipeptidase-like Zn-dependent dipeptidase